MDLREPVCVMGVADQRFTRIRDLVCFSLAGADVDSLSTKNLPQGLNFSAALCALCVKELVKRRERRDTQRAAEKITAFF